VSIRGRLLTLAVGGVVPLLVVGLAVLWAVWAGKQQRLDESLEQQAELAAVVFDRWLDAQRQPLLTLAAYPAARLQDPAALEADLRAALAPRRHWVDLRLLDAGGRLVASHPPGAEPLPEAVAARLLEGARRGLAEVETDRTPGEGDYVLAIAAPVEGGGAVVARLGGAALREPLRGLTLPERALVTLLDPRRRVVYRSRTPESASGADLSYSAMLPGLDGQATAVARSKSAPDGVERVYGLARVGATGYVVLVGVPSDILYASAWRQLTGYAVAGLVVVLGTMTGALLVARSIVRPVRLLSLAAGREDMPVLFDKFHRGRPAPHSEATRGAATGAEFLEDADVSGVGLGLYLGRNVMEQMGGRITVEPEVGRGSTFTLHLPVWREGGCGERPGRVGDGGETSAGR